MTTRREILKGAGALVAAAVMPTPAVAAELGAPIAATAIEMPKPVAWLVGQEQTGYKIVFAEDSKQAALQWADEFGVDYCERSDGASPCDDDDCEDCYDAGGIDVDRKPSMDRFQGRESDITDIDMHRINVCVPCKWCEDQDAYQANDEFPHPGDVFVVAGMILCDECKDAFDRMMDDEYGLAAKAAQAPRAPAPGGAAIHTAEAHQQ